MSDFKCPKCGEPYSVAELELWEVYEEDGKQTEFTCGSCDYPMTVISKVTGWEFVAVLDDDL